MISVVCAWSSSLSGEFFSTEEPLLPIL